MGHTTMLDLDGVVYPFDVTFRAWASRNAGTQLSEAVEWHFYEEWGWTSARFIEELHRFGAEGGFADAQPLPGAADMVKRLVDAGHTVHVVTDRPETAVADTGWWVNEFLPDVTSLTVSRDKTVFKQYGNPTYYAFDDRIENVATLRQAGVFAFLRTQPWNSKSDLPRCDTLDEYVRVVTRS